MKIWEDVFVKQVFVLKIFGDLVSIEIFFQFCNFCVEIMVIVWYIYFYDFFIYGGVVRSVVDDCLKY